MNQEQEPRNFKEFQSTRQLKTWENDKEYLVDNIFGCNANIDIYEYFAQCWIEILDDKYHLFIMNESWVSKDLSEEGLEELEKILYEEWVLIELIGGE